MLDTDSLLGEEITTDASDNRQDARSETDPLLGGEVSSEGNNDTNPGARSTSGQCRTQSTHFPQLPLTRYAGSLRQLTSSDRSTGRGRSLNHFWASLRTEGEPTGVVNHLVSLPPDAPEDTVCRHPSGEEGQEGSLRSFGVSIEGTRLAISAFTPEL